MTSFLQGAFGLAVRRIVEGETKFSKIGELSSETVSKGDVKARDLQHLFLAMTKEVSSTEPGTSPPPPQPLRTRRSVTSKPHRCLASLVKPC